MEPIHPNGYVPGALLTNTTIREMRSYVEYQKFACRILVDNDDIRQFAVNTEQHADSIHRFIYNNPEIERITMKGKNKLIGKTTYVPSTTTGLSPTVSPETSGSI